MRGLSASWSAWNLSDRLEQRKRAEAAARSGDELADRDWW